MRIHLIRHGECLSDTDDSFGGIADFALSPGGRKQASVLAESLAGSGLAVIYSSPYRRALETAAIIRCRTGAPLTVVPGLCERNCFGVLSGVSRARARELFPHVLAAIKGRPGDFYSGELLTGAEPVEEFVARGTAAFHHVIADAQGCREVAVVTHGNVIRAIYRDILGVLGRVSVAHASVTLIEVQQVRASVLASAGVVIERR
jgi:broad specificity phosphatase PhoE